jgi:hypothetical protein
MDSEHARDTSTRYNALAQREGWHSFCSVGLTFESEKLNALHGVWKALAAENGIPSRKSLTPQVLRAHLADIAIYERTEAIDGNVRWRIRIMGDRMCAVLGNFNGKFFNEIAPPKSLRRWHAAPDAALEARVPLRFVSRSETAGKGYLTGEYFVAPLTGDDGGLNTVLSGAAFGPTLLDEAGI